MSISPSAMPEGGSCFYIFSYGGGGYLSSHDAGPFLKPEGSVFERWNLEPVAADSESKGGKILLSRCRDGKHYSARHFHRGVKEEDKLEVLHAGYATVLSSASAENVIVPVVSFRDEKGRSLRLNPFRIRVGFNRGGDCEYANECLWLLLTEPALAGAIDSQTRMIAACSAGVLGAGLLGLGGTALAVAASAASTAAAACTTTAAVTAAAVDATVATTTAVGAASVASATSATAVSAAAAVTLTTTAATGFVVAKNSDAIKKLVIEGCLQGRLPEVEGTAAAEETKPRKALFGKDVGISKTTPLLPASSQEEPRQPAEAEEDESSLLPHISVSDLVLRNLWEGTFVQEQTAQALTPDAFQTEQFRPDTRVVESLAKLLHMSQYSEEKLREAVKVLEERFAKQTEEDLLADMSNVLGEDPLPDLLGSLDKQQGVDALSALLLQVVAQMPDDFSVFSDTHVERSMVTAEIGNTIRIFALHPTLKAHVRRSSAGTRMTGDV